MDVLIFKVDVPDDLEKATSAALNATGKGAQAAAIVLSQKFWARKDSNHDRTENRQYRSA